MSDETSVSMFDGLLQGEDFLKDFLQGQNL